jgi:hypothetical protein
LRNSSVSSTQGLCVSAFMVCFIEFM